MSATTPAPTSGFLQRHDEDGFLEAIKLMIDSGKVATPDDLIRAAEQAGEPNAAEYLRGFAAQGLPLSLIYDAFSVHARIVAFKRNTDLLKECQGKKVGLVMPLPPHVIEGFLGLPDLIVITPDGHQLPAVLRRRNLTVHTGSRAGRKVIADLGVVVFEAFRKNKTYSLDQTVADVVDPRIIPATSLLVVHLRPHASPDDQLLEANQTLRTL
jgi:hypothetical protein